MRLYGVDVPALAARSRPNRDRTLELKGQAESEGELRHIYFLRSKQVTFMDRLILF